MRTPIIAGNWKMHKTIGESIELADGLLRNLAGIDNVTIAVCPPFTALHAVGELTKGTDIKMGAQDMFWQASGAYTGMISPVMLKDVGCKYVIVGHSERRGRFGKLDADMTEELLSVFGDNDATVNKKARVVLRRGLSPIICCGELRSERQARQTDAVVKSQVEAALKGITKKQMARVTIAYEPVWAIGADKACNAREADRVCGIIRETVGQLYTTQIANDAIIQYGGNVNPKNIKRFMARGNIDGALVGGASLRMDDFTKIVKAASKAK